MRGCQREPDGVRRSSICGGVVQLVRTPPCHAGGRGFESRRSRQLSASRSTYSNCAGNESSGVPLRLLARNELTERGPLRRLGQPALFTGCELAPGLKLAKKNQANYNFSSLLRQTCSESYATTPAVLLLGCLDAAVIEDLHRNGRCSTDFRRSRDPRHLLWR